MAAEKRDGVWKPGKFLEKHPIASVFLLTSLIHSIPLIHK